MERNATQTQRRILGWETVPHLTKGTYLQECLRGHSSNRTGGSSRSCSCVPTVSTAPLQGQEDEADGTITSPGPGQAHATSFVRSRADGRRAPRTGACYWLLAYCYCVCARTCITHRTSWPPHVAQEAVRSSSLALS